MRMTRFLFVAVSALMLQVAICRGTEVSGAGPAALRSESIAVKQPDPAFSKWVTGPVKAPRVEYHEFESKAASNRVSFHIYTPGTYDTSGDNRFPVLYWLHGSGGGAAGIGPVSAMFDRAIREGKIPPMLVIFPNGMASSMWCDSKDGLIPMETVLVKELVAHVDGKYRTIAQREGRIIEGFSMGGYGAARLGFKYPQLFGATSVLAGGPLDLDFQGPRAASNPAERNRILRAVYGDDMEFFRKQSPRTLGKDAAGLIRDKLRIRIVVGDADFTAGQNRELSADLESLKITHTLDVIPGVGHSVLPLLLKLGDKNWEFYRSAFASVLRQKAAEKSYAPVVPPAIKK